MRIAIGSDHGGWELKQLIVSFLKELGLDTLDIGCDSSQSVDYPVFADAVCEKVTSGDCDKGILVCGTGIGMSIAANRDRKIRAALCHDTLTAKLSREHNDANVLCLGGRMIGTTLAVEIVRTWIEADFAGDRHQRRIDMFS